jgi:hypothetical protein
MPSLAGVLQRLRRSFKLPTHGYRVGRRKFAELDRRLLVILSLAVPIVFSCAAPPAVAEDKQTDGRVSVDWSDRYRKGTWDFTLESAYTFDVVPNPFHCLVDLRIRSPNPRNYHFATEVLGVSYRLTKVGGPWFLRGSAQLCAGVVGTAIVWGPESYFVGLAVGMHYDFVQPGWRLVPYMDFRGGPGAIDAAKKVQAQQSDIEFTYLWGAGFRYDVSPTLSVSIGALDQHLSDAGLATENNSVDSLGVSIGVMKKF